jgi:7tm Odorant receptor
MQKLQELFKIPMFCGILLIATVIVLCFYEITVIESVVSVYFAARFHLIPCVLIEILMYAGPCEKIKEESERIRERLYNSSLHQMNMARLAKWKLKELKSSLNIVTMQANKMVKITAGGFFVLSYGSYSEVSSILIEL